MSEALTPQVVEDRLHEVIDPELGVNIVDLGLVYDVTTDDGVVSIEMTLTTPGCPLGGYIEDEIQRSLEDLPHVRDIAVQIVWDPPWDPELMSGEARAQLGWSV